MFHSEDYYGDLDLKTIRKSELLQGLQGAGQSRANAASSQSQQAAPKAAPKPRPAAPARPAPQSRPATQQPGQVFEDGE